MATSPYAAAVTRAHKATRKARAFFAYAMMTQIVSLAIVCIFLAQTALGQNGRITSFRTAGALVVVLLWIITMISLLRNCANALRFHEGEIAKGTLYRAPKGAAGDVCVSIERFAALMEVEELNVKIWIYRSRSLSPFTFELNGQTCFALPLGFIALFKSKKTHAQVMLAHELGHVIQQDANLWKMSLVVGLPLYAKLIAINVLALIYDVVCEVIFLGRDLNILMARSDLFQYGYTRPSIQDIILGHGVLMLAKLAIATGMIILLHRARRNIRRARYTSEYLADVASAICVGITEYCDTIRELVGAADSTNTHPAGDLRIDAVCNFLEGKRSLP